MSWRNTFKVKYGDWALIAGGAEGIGEAFTTQLATMGFNLVLVDKNEDSLKALREIITTEYRVQVRTIHLDLIEESAPSSIIKEIGDIKCQLLVYNAAFSLIKKFTDHSAEDLDRYLHVNVSVPLKLTHLFVYYLKERSLGGGILLMSSLAGLVGMHHIAPYAASKAFTWNLAEALHFELKKENIDVTSCIAGATLSQTYINTRPKYGLIKPQLEQPETVAKNALRNLGKRGFFISGFGNRINYFILTRILPRRMAGKMANRVMAKMYDYV